jgi:sec-independent protein translocase protein TatC
MSEENAASVDKEESFISHLIELRDRLLRSVIVVLIVFIPCAIFSGRLFTLLAAPMLSALSTDGTMISTEVAGPFLVPLKFAFALSIAIAIPYLLYQLWAFIAPGLYENEKRLAFPLLLSSTLLFYCGVAFAYFVVFPIMFAFFPSVAPMGIEVTPDINHYLGFVLKLFFAFGIAFEVPIATILVIKAGITTREKLAAKRRYVVLAAFVMGMLLTPPDIFSQSMLALPMWLLFEMGLIMSRYLGGKKSDDASQDMVPATATATATAGASAAAASTTATAADSDTDNQAKSTEDENAFRAAYDEEDDPEGYYDEDDDDGEEEEEDLDAIIEELDNLEDITSWTGQSEDEGKGSDQDKKED